MDFVEIVASEVKNSRKDEIIIIPEFKYSRVKDIICKGGQLYAFWNGEKWSEDLDDLIDAIDTLVKEKCIELKNKYPERRIICKYMSNHSSGVMQQFDKYVGLIQNRDIPFNRHIIFSDHELIREDYSTRQLGYTPTAGSTEIFDRILNHLYNPEEADKILWFIGLLIANKMAHTQKFMFLYGRAGSGKGTILKIFKMLFEGYHEPISLQQLTSNTQFATAQIKEVPLMIDDDTDISSIKNDTPLLKLTAHEPIIVDAKYKTPYQVTFPGVVVAASNKAFKVRNVDAGIVRRAIVVHPSDRTFKADEYMRLMEKIKFEIPYIAYKAMQRFNEMGVYYYEGYIPSDIMEQTDVVYSFMKEHAEMLGDEVTLKKAYTIFESYLDDLGFDKTNMKPKFTEELKRYYREFHKQRRIDGVKMRSVYYGLKRELLIEGGKIEVVDKVDNSYTETVSKFDMYYKDNTAQYANDNGIPQTKWDNVTTKLQDINTSRLHWVKVDPNHIVIDFDLKDMNGNKSLERNIEAAAKFPDTYGEISKSGNGIHLHYIYDGDVSKLSSIFDKDIEIKVYKGNASLRRMHSFNNGLEIKRISSGLPLKEDTIKFIDSNIVYNESLMINIIKRCLRKEVHSSTKSNMDLIYKVFTDAYNSGVQYDLTFMRSDIIGFATRSTNQAKACIKMANDIVYNTYEEPFEDYDLANVSVKDLVFFDIEVFKNVVMLGYKKYDDPFDRIEIIVNPPFNIIENLIKQPLVGFNNLGYDNHILYDMLQGASPYEIFLTSQRIINSETKSNNYKVMDLSYADIYDFATKKQSLKKWQIELGLKHDEFEHPWDQPLPEELFDRCKEYLINDIISTEAVFKHLDSDYQARLILSELSGLSVMNPNNNHTAKILFDNEKEPQKKFNYTDLSEMFKGYTFDGYKSIYRGEVTGEGGYVYSKPGYYTNVGLFDVASMHPNSLINMNYFGPYTQRYADLVQIRLNIKHKDLTACMNLFDGRLQKYLQDIDQAKGLSNALKIVINSVYGMTSAPFKNKFKHELNVDNIVAKRGALFMIDLKYAVMEQGYEVIHIKTDSIKVANVDDYIKNFIMEFGKKYGYKFEHEHTYEKMCLVNKAVYIAKYDDVWEAVGTEFQVPLVYKHLFTGEELEVSDYFITKQAKSPIYIGDKFIGKSAHIYASLTGKEIHRQDNPEKKSALAGTKGFKWRLASDFAGVEDIDRSYYKTVLQKAVDSIQKYVNFEDFTGRKILDIDGVILPF